MRILMIASGTRGDVQPLLALAQHFKQRGYVVAVAAGSDFAEYVAAAGILYENLGVDIQAMMSSPDGKAWVESSQWTMASKMKRVFMNGVDELITSMLEIIPRYDVIIAGLTSLPLAQVIADYHGKPIMNLMLQPAYPTRLGASNMVAFRPQANSALNLLMRPIMSRTMWYTSGDGVKIVTERLGLPAYTFADFTRDYFATPGIIAVSPLVAPAAPDYPDHITVTGYLFLDSDDWTPPPSLQTFLEAGEPPVYIGFGSMTGANFVATINMLVTALAGRRGIIARGWADFDASTLPDSVYLLDSAPHDWLFPRMAAAVHHGGAGTTAAGLRAGIPTVIIPHMADQPYYGRRVYELGVGPKPVPRGQITAERLRSVIETAVTSDAIGKRAASIGQAIREENGVGDTADWILSRL